MSNPQRSRILVVEDDPVSRMTLVAFLRENGYEVSWAVDGSHALSRLSDDRPDLVISDVCMPGTDGFELTRKLRERTGGRETRLILVSGRSETERRIQGLDLGADDFLAKPVDPDELLARVRAQLRRARRHSDAVRLSMVDGLTDVLNRRGLFESLAQSMAETRAAGRPLSVLLVDVDDFKQINDTFGHHVGDEVLKNVGAMLLRHAPARDCVGRIGGDEFVVVLPGSGRVEAVAVADRLRSVEGPLGSGRVGLSVGVATLRSEESADEMLGRADGSMYERKRRVRERRSVTRRSNRPPDAVTGTTYGLNGASGPRKRKKRAS